MITHGQMALLDRASVILKVNFSRQIAVLASVINGLINYFINLILIFVLIFINNLNAEELIILNLGGITYMMFVSIVAFILCFAFSLFSSILTIRFRDLKNIFELGFALLYWATPIFYTLEEGLIKGDIKTVVRLNPLTIFINEFRSGLNIFGSINYNKTFILLVFSLVLLFLGFYFFEKQVKKVAELF